MISSPASLLACDNQDCKLWLEADGKLVVRIEGSSSESFCELADLPKNPSGRHCRDLSFEEITAASGSVPLFLDESSFEKLFPGVLRLLPNG
jgi:hypothetical protein